MTNKVFKIGFVGFLLFSSLGYFASRGRTAQSSSPPDTSDAVTVGAARATRQDISRDLEIAAEFRPYQEIEVYAKVAGYVKKIYVDYGTHVKNGQVLAILEVPELNDELERSAAATRAAEADVTSAKEEMNRDDAVHKVTHLEYTRLAAVLNTRPGLIAQQDIDNALGRDQEAEAKIAAGKAAEAAAEQQLQVAKANEQKERTLLAYTKITAPFNGIITRRYADDGSMIQQGTASHTQAMPLVRLAQSDVLRLVIPVPESSVPSIRLGETIDISVPSLNQKFKGTVARFADQLDLDTRTMHTEVDVPNSDLVLVPGMYAYARLTIAQKPNALTVPIQAVSRVGDKTTVMRIGTDGKIEERSVQLGLETPNEVEITSGLDADDLVVVGDRSTLRQGEVVHPKIVSGASWKGRS